MITDLTPCTLHDFPYCSYRPLSENKCLSLPGLGGSKDNRRANKKHLKFAHLPMAVHATKQSQIKSSKRKTHSHRKNRRRIVMYQEITLEEERHLIFLQPTCSRLSTNVIKPQVHNCLLSFTEVCKRTCVCVYASPEPDPELKSSSSSG